MLFLRHKSYNELSSFVKNEHGVVALAFAIIFPVVAILILMSFQFDQYNRHITRVQQAQFAALRGAYKQNDDLRELLTEKWVRFNTAMSRGLSIANEDNYAWEKSGYLWISTTLEDSTPVLSWALGERFNSTMRIRLYESSDPTTCGNTYWKALYKCGKLSVNELRKISNEERVKIDQMALVNIGKNFFDSSGVGKKRGEIQTLFGSQFTSESILINYVDNHNVGDDAKGDAIQTYLKGDSNKKYAQTLEYMKSDGSSDDNYGLSGSDDYVWKNLISEAQHEVIEGDENSATYSDLDGVTHTRFFFSDWMLEDMHDWQNVKDGYQDNCRTLRITVTYNADKVESVRIRVNRGAGQATNGTHYYELDVTVTSANYSETADLSKFQTNQKLFSGQLLSGIERYETDSDFKTWYKKATKKDYTGTYDPQSIADYHLWYEIYLHDNRRGGGYGYGAALTEEKAKEVSDRLVPLSGTGD